MGTKDAVEVFREITHQKDQEDESPPRLESLKKGRSQLSIKREVSSKYLRINNFEGAADWRKSRRMGKRGTSKGPKFREAIKETCTNRLHAHLEQKDRHHPPSRASGGERQRHRAVASEIGDTKVQQGREVFVRSEEAVLGFL